jgi:hypothetical protein
MLAIITRCQVVNFPLTVRQETAHKTSGRNIQQVQSERLAEAPASGAPAPDPYSLAAPGALTLPPPLPPGWPGESSQPGVRIRLRPL